MPISSSINSVLKPEDTSVRTRSQRLDKTPCLNDYVCSIPHSVSSTNHPMASVFTYDNVVPSPPIWAHNSFFWASYVSGLRLIGH